jgi:hypothetical protein
MNELTNCPFCQGDFLIKEVECQSCHAQIKGQFKTNRFHILAPDDLFFIEIFLKNEGNIKLVEKDLKISYPTVKNRLKNIIKILGYQTEETPEKQRLDILRDISEGKIDVETALKQLKNLP